MIGLGVWGERFGSVTRGLGVWHKRSVGVA